MKIVVEEDRTGFAPSDHRFSAYDPDTYDGAEDSKNRHMVGVGPTKIEAVRDLLWKMDDSADIVASQDALAALDEEDEIECEAEYRLVVREPDPRDDP